MTGSWSLLITEEDWQKYQAMYAQAADFHPNQVNWGKGPQSYPCLAASSLEKGSVLLGAKKILSAYVYVSDAQKLLEHAGMSVVGAQAVTTSPMQAAFNKAMMAHTMTIIDAMVRSGICTKEQYEKWFAGMLSKADQMSMEDMETIVRTVTGDGLPADESDEPSEPDDEDDDDDDDGEETA